MPILLHLQSSNKYYPLIESGLDNLATTYSLAIGQVLGVRYLTPLLNLVCKAVARPAY